MFIPHCLLLNVYCSLRIGVSMVSSIFWSMSLISTQDNVEAAQMKNNMNNRAFLALRSSLVTCIGMLRLASSHSFCLWRKRACSTRVNQIGGWLVGLHFISSVKTCTQGINVVVSGFIICILWLDYEHALSFPIYVPSIVENNCNKNGWNEITVDFSLTNQAIITLRCWNPDDSDAVGDFPLRSSF